LARRRGAGRLIPRIWLEAALNGPWGRSRRPDIPVIVEEIVADSIACDAIDLADRGRKP
jgi:hypothetical protein